MRTALSGVCSVALMSLIFYLSSIPGDELGPDILSVNLMKKAGHAAVYGLLAALFLSTLQGRKPLSETGNVLFILGFVLALLYAVSDEYHQSFTPGRHASAYDVIIDACGAVIILASLYALKTRRRPAPARVT